MEMEKFQTFSEVNEVENYFKLKDEISLAKIQENQYLISEGFFRNLDGKDRVTKNIILSDTYSIKEDKLQNYKTENPFYTTEQLTLFKSKLHQIQSRIETIGKVYTSRGACGVFGSCCSYFEIYEVKYRDTENKIKTIIWTSFIHDKILKNVSESIKFSHPRFFGTISDISDAKVSTLIPYQKPLFNSKSTCPSYSEVIEKLNQLTIHDNPLFLTENKEVEKAYYREVPDLMFNNRHLERRELKEMKNDEYIVEIRDWTNDLLVGITSSELENIEYIYFDASDGIELPKHSEILYNKRYFE